MKEKQILRSLGQVDEKYIEEAEPMNKTNKKNNRKKWLSVAACLAVIAVIGAGGVFKSGLLGAKTDRVTLNSGETITFVKSDLAVGNLDLDVTVRELNTDEIKMLFGDLSITAFAYFDAESHDIIGFEGKFDNMKMVVSKSGVQLLDTVIEGNKYTSTVDNVSINAGYFVTKANSQGVKTAIYYADFDIGENTIYIENSGAEDENENTKNELVKAIEQLIENGEFDLSQIEE